MLRNGGGRLLYRTREWPIPPRNKHKQSIFCPLIHPQIRGGTPRRHERHFGVRSPLLLESLGGTAPTRGPSTTVRTRFPEKNPSLFYPGTESSRSPGHPLVANQAYESNNMRYFVQVDPLTCVICRAHFTFVPDVMLAELLFRDACTCQGHMADLRNRTNEVWRRSPVRATSLLSSIVHCWPTPLADPSTLRRRR